MTAFLERVWERGDIYKSDYEGFYCIDCEEYKVRRLCLCAYRNLEPLTSQLYSPAWVPSCCTSCPRLRHGITAHGVARPSDA